MYIHMYIYDITLTVEQDLVVSVGKRFIKNTLVRGGVYKPRGVRQQALHKEHISKRRRIQTSWCPSATASYRTH